MYMPQAQLPDAANALNVRITPMAWVVRTRAAPYGVSAAVQEQLRAGQRSAGVERAIDGATSCRDRSRVSASTCC